MTILSKQLLNDLYKYAYVLCKNEDDAFDLTHSSIEKAFLKLNNVDNVKAYLYTSIKNTFIDEKRKSSHLELVEYSESVDSFDLLNQFIETKLCNIAELEAIFERCNSKDRELLYYLVIEGYTSKELSEILSIPEGTLTSRFHRLKIKLSSLSIRKAS